MSETMARARSGAASMARAALSLPRDAQIRTSVSKIISIFANAVASRCRFERETGGVGASGEDRQRDRLNPRGLSRGQTTADPWFWVRRCLTPVRSGSAWPSPFRDRGPSPFPRGRWREARASFCNEDRLSSPSSNVSIQVYISAAVRLKPHRDWRLCHAAVDLLGRHVMQGADHHAGLVTVIVSLPTPETFRPCPGEVADSTSAALLPGDLDPDRNRFADRPHRTAARHLTRRLPNPPSPHTQSTESITPKPGARTAFPSDERKRKMFKTYSITVACLLLAGCKPKIVGPLPMGPVEVAFVTIGPQSLALTTQLPGRTAAYLTAENRPQVNGIVQNRLFEEGASVKAGDLVYRIDSAPYEASYSQAKASLATAEADLATAEANLPSLKSRAERYRDLAAIHAVGQQDYDDASASLEQARATVMARRASIETSRAALETARINLSYTPIKAPISGRIGKSNITVGALATAYQASPLAIVQQLDPIYVDVVQANAELLRLRHSLESGGMRQDGAGERKVKLILEDGSTYSMTGTLQFRDVTVDSSTGAVTLRVVFPNPREVLLPGMFVRAVVEEGVRPQAMLIPQQGVGRDPKGNPYAWVVGKDEKVEQKPLQLERAVGDQWLVTSGLAAEDRVIVEGVGKVRPGM